VNPLRSVRGRLSIAFGIVLIAGLGLVELIVVPSLERNLIDSKVSELRQAAPGVAEQIGSPVASTYLTNKVQTAASAANARVLVFASLDPSRNAYVLDDSNIVNSAPYQDDPIALRVFRTLESASGTVRRGKQRYAEAATLLGNGFVVLLSAPLHDTLANVDLVRRRILIGGLIALVAALAVGYAIATMFARRLHRLERAADRLASGDFSEPVADEGSDEVGQLARAFERMRERLAQLEHARREFIANASHELRTPLFSLGGFLELIENEELEPRTQREFLATMREQVDRLTKLATDLLDLSRLDAGRLHVEAEPVDLDAVARSLVDEFRAVARSSGHDLAVVGNGEAEALADEERALQIGRILVENALVHTAPGTAVRLRSERRDGIAVLEVEDEGGGIPREHTQHVFERFYRVEGASTASGSGLGLAIARELAELMGGAIELDSRPGRTVFRLRLRGHADFPHMSESDSSFPVKTEDVRLQ
jgi:signal transduction histidine kinase